MTVKAENIREVKYFSQALFRTYADDDYKMDS